MQINLITAVHDNIIQHRDVTHLAFADDNIISADDTNQLNNSFGAFVTKWYLTGHKLFYVWLLLTNDNEDIARADYVIDKNAKGRYLI